MEKEYLLKCMDCGKDFFTKGEKEFYRSKGLHMPKRCKNCRKKRKQIYDERQRHRDISLKLNNLALKKIDKDHLELLDPNSTLFIIGNGFDLMHDIPSGYYNFRDSLGKNNNIRLTLETLVDAENIWGDFESNLAYLNRESMLITIDMWLDNFNVLDEDDINFSVANYFMAQEAATDPIHTLIYELPKRFRQWIESLEYKGNNKPLLNIINKNASYINFNYTEFLEIIYGVPKDNILYIHGDRRNKNEELILGHGHNTDRIYEEWYQANKTRKEYQPIISKGKVKYDKNDNPVYLGYFLKDDSIGNWKNQTRYDAINNTVYRIESYYDDSEKKTQDVLTRNKKYFKSLNNIKNIVSIGHSLSDVDLPYFREILKGNKYKDSLNWYFSAYNLESLEQILNFSSDINLNSKNMAVFLV